MTQLLETYKPQDAKCEFDPQIVKKHQTDISSLEDQVLSMNLKEMTTRDISEQLMMYME